MNLQVIDANERVLLNIDSLPQESDCTPIVEETYSDLKGQPRKRAHAGGLKFLNRLLRLCPEASIDSRGEFKMLLYPSSRFFYIFI